MLFLAGERFILKVRKDSLVREDPSVLNLSVKSVKKVVSFMTVLTSSETGTAHVRQGGYLPTGVGEAYTGYTGTLPYPGVYLSPKVYLSLG